MQNLLGGSGEFAVRHELDALAPTRVVVAEPATQAQLGELALLARQEIPGVCASEEILAQFWQHDPKSIFSFSRGASLLGGIAFLYLNCRGLDALLLDQIDLKQPDRELLAHPDEDVAGIYVWALAAHGRAAIGLGNVAEFLRSARFCSADYYAQPSTGEGRALLISLGFEPIPSFQPDLWCYRRSRNRLPSMAPPSSHSIRSIADARH
jgi:hypothetical protein